MVTVVTDGSWHISYKGHQRPDHLSTPKAEEHRPEDHAADELQTGRRAVDRECPSRESSSLLDPEGTAFRVIVELRADSASS